MENKSVKRYRARRAERLKARFGEAREDSVELFRQRRDSRVLQARFDASARLAFGIAKGLGINTEGMAPKEVWEAIREKDPGAYAAAHSGGKKSKRGQEAAKSSGYVNGWRPPKVSGMEEAEVHVLLSKCNKIGGGHYDKAREVANADNRPFLWTFTTHGRDHVQQVIDKTNQAADAIEKLPEDGVFRGAKIDRKLMLTAAWFHDTGMDGGDKDWGDDTGDGIRASHGVNSALHILEHAKEIEAMGVDPNKAALIAFAHTKSKSEILDLRDPTHWEKGCQKLEEAAKAHNPPLNFDRKSVFDGDPHDDNIYEMAAQVAALRLGDANREAKGNELLSQSGGKYTIEKQVENEKCFSWESEVEGSVISITDDEGKGDRHVLSKEDPKMSKVEHWDLSAMTVLGERNMDVVDSRYNEKYKYLQEDVSLKDGNAVPWSTTAALLERVGELNTINGIASAIVVHMNGVDGPGHMTENAAKAYQKMWDTMKRRSDKYGRVDSMILVFGNGQSKLIYGGNGKRSLREMEK